MLGVPDAELRNRLGFRGDVHPERHRACRAAVLAELDPRPLAIADAHLEIGEALGDRLLDVRRAGAPVCLLVGERVPAGTARPLPVGEDDRDRDARRRRQRALGLAPDALAPDLLPPRRARRLVDRPVGAEDDAVDDPRVLGRDVARADVDRDGLRIAQERVAEAASAAADRDEDIPGPSER